MILSIRGRYKEINIITLKEELNLIEYSQLLKKLVKINN